MAMSAQEKKWRKKRQMLVGNTMIPAHIVRAHIQMLVDSGMGTRRIIALSGSANVRAILAGHTTMTREETARRILALKPDPAKGASIDSLGTRRRIEALMWMGWSHEMIAHRIGVFAEQVSRILRRKQCTVATAEAVRAVFDELSGTFGPSRRSMQRARRNGYLPPLAWDDIDTDRKPSQRQWKWRAA